MLSTQDLEALAQAGHGDPFAVLGLHRARARTAGHCTPLLPGRTVVRCSTPRAARRVATLDRVHDDGVWAASWQAPRRTRFDYRLARAAGLDGGQGVYADAYAFGALIDDADLHSFGEGRAPAPVLVARCASRH